MEQQFNFNNVRVEPEESFHTDDEYRTCSPTEDPVIIDISSDLSQNIAAQGHIGELELVDLIVERLNCNMVQATMLATVTSVSELKHTIERLECRGQEWLKQRSSVDNQMTEVRCYNCFMYGHYQSDCKKPKRPPNSCFVCSEGGHTRHECQRRVRKRAVGAVKTDLLFFKDFVLTALHGVI